MKSTLRLEREVLFNADLLTVHRVLLDTENYPKYIKSISSARVIYKAENESEVSYTAKLSFFTFEYSIKTTKVSENQITFEQKNGFFKFLNGEWKLKECNDQVVGKYIINVKLPLLAAGKIAKMALDVYFPAMLNDFKSEIERSFKEG